MANSIDFILTNAAYELISKVISGKTLNFTRMAIGDGFSYDTTAAKGYKTLVNEILSIDITKKEPLSPSSVRITSAFKNTDLEKEFYYREVGLYAQDPETGEEVLYAYGNRNDAAELITPTGSNVVNKQLVFIISVGDSANVTFNVNAGVYALQEDLTTLQANLHELNSTKANDAETKQAIAVERARITNLAKLNDGSTTGDAELIDMRTDDEGDTHENAGEAFRTRTKSLKKDIDVLRVRNNDMYNKITAFELSVGAITDANGEIDESRTDVIRTQWIETHGMTFVLVKNGFTAVVAVKKEDGTVTYLTKTSTSTTPNLITILDNARLCIELKTINGEAATAEMFIQNIEVYTQNDGYGLDKNNLVVDRNIPVEFIPNTGLSTSDYTSWSTSATETATIPYWWVFNNGIIEIKNPDSKSIIFYEIAKDFKKISRTVYTDGIINIPVYEGHYYWVSMYKYTSFADYANITCRYTNNVNTSDTPAKEIALKLENGTFYANGENADSSKAIRTQKINTKKNCIYLFTFPNGLNSNVNYLSKASGSSRKNSSTTRYTPYSITDYSGFIRFVLYNGTDTFNMSMLDETELQKIKLYEIPLSKDGVCVSTVGSFITGDIACNGTNDQMIIQGLLSCVDASIPIRLAGGTYHFNEFYTARDSEQKAMLMTDDMAYSLTTNRTYDFQGLKSTRESDSEEAKLMIDIDSSLITNDAEYSFLLVPRPAKELETTVSSNSNIVAKNFTIAGDLYTKPFVFIDATHAKSARIADIKIRGDKSLTGLSRFPTKPNINCVGIRAGYGSNNGIQNYIKRCMVYFCGKGYSINGEHYILEDCLAHHCYYGFAFGDRATRGNFEHPNMMIGCSIESCYRLMYLSKNGVTVEQKYVAGALSNVMRSTLIAIGTSTETRWDIPTDELVEGSPDNQRTKPILEIVKGCYRGRIELDYMTDTSPFEEGSCIGMQYINYNSTTM